MDISGKRAVVFGGTSGIGLAAVRQLAEGGAQVIAVSRNPDRSQLPAGVAGRACDVLDREGLQGLFADEDPFDIIVSAATGGERAVGPFLEMDMDGFAGSFDKLWGYANVVRFGVPTMSQDGTVVLVSGAPARRVKPGQVAIGATGAAVESLVRSIAPEIRPRRINVVSPGTIATPMFGPDSEGRDQALAGMTKANLIQRAGTADEVAQAIMFCVTNDFVTGTTVDVDGGWLLS